MREIARGAPRALIFGAGGTLGRLAISEALARGHQVTAAVRDPGRHPDLAGARVVAADATDPDSVAAAAVGDDVAIPSLYRQEPPHDIFYRSGGDAVLGERMSYADFAIALLDEIEAPAHHRTRIAVSS